MSKNTNTERLNTNTDDCLQMNPENDKHTQKWAQKSMQ